MQDSASGCNQLKCLAVHRGCAAIIVVLERDLHTQTPHGLHKRGGIYNTYPGSTLTLSGFF